MFSEKVYQGKTAFVTGGGTGIGLGIARELGRLGARVFIASRNEERLAAAAQELEREGIEAAWAKMEIREPAQVAAAVAAAVARFGRVDVLVNNAAGNFVCPTEKLSPNGWRAVVGIVLDGTFYATREVGRHLIERGEGGQIVSLVATYAWTGAPGLVPSACAKAGVVAMTRSLAVEWARHKIRVNAIAPGAVLTEGATSQLWADPEAQAAIRANIPAGRFGTVEEIARVVAWIASPYADYITGEVISADGGEWHGKGLHGLSRHAVEGFAGGKGG